MAQTAAKLVLEPIFEVDLDPEAYGYRPKRSAQDAIRRVPELLCQGYDDVVDADLSKYFDTIPHAELIACVARLISDRRVLKSKRVLTRIGLSLNPAKTKAVDAKTESFDFLGYTFGPHRFRKDGHWYLGASPSKNSVQRLKQKMRELLRPSHVGTWDEVRERLNRGLRGWSNYFSYGTRTQAYRAVDHFVYQRVRGFLQRRHKVRSRGTRRFRDEAVFGKRGVVRLRRVRLGPPPATAMR